MVMNEQIQNLKDKIWTEEYWTKPNTDKLLPAQLNKFAELIVRECEKSIKSVPTHFEAQDKIIVECLKSIRETFQS
jgi:hypothetical protein